MSFQVTEHLQLDDRLLSEWQALWDASPSGHFFNSPQWYLACQKTGFFQNCRILAVQAGNSYLAFIPLCQEKIFGVKALAFPGGKHLDKSSWLVKDNNPAVLAAAVAYLAKNHNFFLAETDEDVAQMLSRAGCPIMLRESSVNPYIPLDGDPFLFLSKKQKNKIFKIIKKHESHLVYRCFKGEDKGLNTAFVVDWNSSKKLEGKPTFVSEQDRQFFRQLLQTFGESVAIDVLYYDGVPIVFSIGFAYKKTYLAHNSAYDSCYHNISPRKLLLYYTLPRLKAEGVELFDFSRGTSSLKQEFTPLSCRQYDVYFAKKILTAKWWSVAGKTYQALLNNGPFYQTYLAAKWILIGIRDKLHPPKSFDINTICLEPMKRVKEAAIEK